MKLFPKILFGILVFVLSVNSHAALITVNASADMTSGLPYTLSLLPIGTKVTSDVTFNIGSGTIDTSIIDNVSGTFSWNDSTFGLQVFNTTSAAISTIHSDGWFSMTFSGSGPTIGGITAESFGIVFNIGTNPFLPPGSTTELLDLVLNGSVLGMRVGASQGSTTHYGDLQDNVVGSINTVPVPGALVLFISGLLGLFSSRVMRTA